ncbi:hypothetical protein BH11MYX4_BH11MYX4_00400 [soil metagenome]
MKLRAAALTAAAGLSLFMGMMHLSSCKDDGTHVYVGRLYVEGRDCLGTSSSVDVVSGDDPGTCDPICMIQPRAEGGRAVYVSTECPPYPAPDFDLTGKDPICARALAALGRNDTCLSDGGTTKPVPPPTDASADGD